MKRLDAIFLVAAVIALYHPAAVAIDEGRFLDKPDPPPGISELSDRSPPAVSEFMVAAADSSEKKRAKVPKFRAGKALKDAVNVSGKPADGGADCGTAWTGLLSDPEADVDPCPAGCVRADRLQVKTDTRGAAAQYDVEYRCIQQQTSGTYLLSPDTNAGASTNTIVDPGVDMPARSPELKGTTGLSSMVPPSPVNGPGAIVIPRANCGTFHTGWVDDPEADVNPCPAACARGERLSLDEHKSSDKTQYDAIYRCYSPEMVVNQTPEIARQIEAGGIKGTNCGTFWTDKQNDPTAGANPCPANCERGELLDVRRDRSYDGSQASYQMMYRCYQAGTMNLPAASKPTASAGDLSVQPTSAESSGPTKASPVSGAPTTVSTQPAIGEGMPQPKELPGSTREISAETLNSVGTTITSIADVTTTSLTVKWKPVAGAMGYTLHAAARGLNHSVESSIEQPAGLPNEMRAPLAGLAPEMEHDVWVSVNYPGGKVGFSEQKSITTLAAVNPLGFEATLIGPGTVGLKWQPVTGAGSYMVEGDNLPRMETVETSVTLSNVSMGSHNWTLIAVYPPGLFNDRNPAKVGLILGSAATSVTGPAASDPNVASQVGSAVGDAARATGNAVHDTAQDVGKAIRETGKTVGDAVHDLFK